MNAILESSVIIETFKTRAEAVSAQVERVATKELAMELIVRLLHKEGVADKPQCGAVWAASRIIGPRQESQLEQAVPGLKFAVTLDLAADAIVCLSQMDW